MKKMNREIVSRNLENGEITKTLNPNLIYFDTSAWIDIFKEYATNKVRIVDEIANAINDRDFRILVSVVNFLELIGAGNEISKNFTKEYVSAINYIRIISANQPTIITDQEVYGFLERRNDGVYIFDENNLALRKLSEGSKQCELGNMTWFLEERKWWDEIQERDRILDLEADMWELSGIKSSASYNIKRIKSILTNPIKDIRVEKAELLRKKQRYNGKKLSTTEEKEILKYAENRITYNIGRKYGEENVSMLISNPLFIFPTKKNILSEILRDLKRGVELTSPIVKNQLPGLYWQAKITYYNYYHGQQRAGGQTGDRNHAVYIPYSNYFATCDRLLIKALESEYKVVYNKGNINLFKIT